MSFRLRRAKGEPEPIKRRYRAPRAWDTAYEKRTAAYYESDGIKSRFCGFRGRLGWKGRTP